MRGASPPLHEQWCVLSTGICLHGVRLNEVQGQIYLFTYPNSEEKFKRGAYIQQSRGGLHYFSLRDETPHTIEIALLPL
jgi:hypothetical protein